MELIDLWKYQQKIRRREALGWAMCLVLVVVAGALIVDPELSAQVAAMCPDSPGGRRAVVFLLDRELDRALASYKHEESAYRYIAGNFESLGARDEGLSGEAIQRDKYLAAMKKHILSLQAERRRLAVKAGLRNRVDREIDYFEEVENDGQ